MHNLRRLWYEFIVYLRTFLCWLYTPFCAPVNWRRSVTKQTSKQSMNETEYLIIFIERKWVRIVNKSKLISLSFQMDIVLLFMNKLGAAWSTFIFRHKYNNYIPFNCNCWLISDMLYCTRVANRAPSFESSNQKRSHLAIECKYGHLRYLSLFTKTFYFYITVHFFSLDHSCIYTDPIFNGSCIISRLTCNVNHLLLAWLLLLCLY